MGQASILPQRVRVQESINQVCDEKVVAIVYGPISRYHVYAIIKIFLSAIVSSFVHQAKGRLFRKI